jgi:TonB family protein
MKGLRMTFGRALALSLVLHAVAYAAGLGWFAWEERQEGMEIDLAHSTLLPTMPNLGGQRPPQPEPDWVLDGGRRLAPQPLALTFTPAAPAEADAGPPCPPPCPSNHGDWAPATSAVRRPEWSEGQITEDDYPTEARYKNQTGRVVVEVLIDAQGHVRSAQLMQGSYEALNDKTLEKIRAARFTPCVDGSGRPFPCRLRLPVAWSLD